MGVEVRMTVILGKEASAGWKCAMFDLGGGHVGISLDGTPIGCTLMTGHFAYLTKKIGLP